MLCLISILIMPAPAYADMGPKPSVVIDFKGLGNEKYYVTLLSEIASTGPHSALGEHPNNQRYHEDDEDYEIWEKFISYQDKDGYYFLQYFRECSETSQFTWGYYPPPEFKILIYFPEYDQFAVSEDVYDRYAFHSYYSVDSKGLELGSITPTENIKAVRNYDYTWELISLFVRIIATIAIEILVALLFGFRAKKQLLIIGAVNIVTQSILNILLNVINYSQGSMMFVFDYIWMEAFVFIIEAGIYSILLPKYSSMVVTKKRLVILYALTANIVSFGLGLYIAYLIPGIF
ncbi:MAG TPA: hypothetical protein GX523_16980 [Desulfitobacterium dehalogenans]|uniref:Uncharacterized protein n=1 Tax=Desulfitobacterium dehalogenans TaxID=36854 RepID=A0A7C7DBT6_9FIRM|nr:hypothetical protein [Desulfitobacterium dehalogenans]